MQATILLLFVLAVVELAGFILLLNSILSLLDSIKHIERVLTAIHTPAKAEVANMDEHVRRRM